MHSKYKIHSSTFKRRHINLSRPVQTGNKPFYLIGEVNALSKYMVGGIIPSKRARIFTKFNDDGIMHEFGVPRAIATSHDNKCHWLLGNAIHDMLRITRKRNSA